MPILKTSLLIRPYWQFNRFAEKKKSIILEKPGRQDKRSIKHPLGSVL